MKRINSLLMMVLIISITGFGQEHPFMKILLGTEEFDYSDFHEFGAVVISDIGNTSFYQTSKGGYDMRFKRKCVIKILSNAGIPHAEVRIPLYKQGADFELLTDVIGISYNLQDGKVVTSELTPGSIFTEEINENWIAKRFTLPAVKEGTVIEYSYTIQSPFLFNLVDWKFQRSVPTVRSEYELRLIPFYTYAIFFQGPKSPDEYYNYEAKESSRQFGNVRFHDVVYFFAMNNVPAFDDEEFISTAEDYLIKLDFQLAKFRNPYGSEIQVMTTWPRVNNDLLKESRFGKYLKDCQKYAKDIIHNLSLEGEGEQIIIKKLTNYVKDNYNWNGVKGILAHQTAKEFASQRTGNIGSVNLFLTCLLQEAGINAKPIILSTRDNGRIQLDYPKVDGFNYVLSFVETDEHYYFLDASRGNYPYYMIPPNVINGKGIIVEKNGERNANLDELDIASLHSNNFKIEIDLNDNSLLIQKDEKLTGYFGAICRGDSREEIEETFSRKFTEMDSFQIQNYYSRDEPLQISCNVKQDLEFYDSVIYIPPFLNEPTVNNPFSKKVRRYPIDMIYLKEYNFNSTIQIPEGYQIKYLPEVLVINNSDFNLSYSTVKNNDSSIQVIGTYAFRKKVYPPESYNKLKYYMNEVIQKFNDQIILKKLKQ